MATSRQWTDTEVELDLSAIEREWLVQCGLCDFGLVEMGCNCPTDDYRPVIQRLTVEVRRQRELIAERGQLEEIGEQLRRRIATNGAAWALLRAAEQMQIDIGDLSARDLRKLAEEYAQGSRLVPEEVATGEPAGAEIFRRVAKLAAEYDVRDELFWHEDLTVFAQCSDVFAWATADLEEIASADDVALFAQSLTDCQQASGDAYLGPALYAARKRAMRPQGAAYPKLAALAALFDACGPERELDVLNPKRPPDPVSDPGTPGDAPRGTVPTDDERSNE